jgi:hypothetical protein
MVTRVDQTVKLVAPLPAKMVVDVTLQTDVRAPLVGLDQDVNQMLMSAEGATGVMPMPSVATPEGATHALAAQAMEAMDTAAQTSTSVGDRTGAIGLQPAITQWAVTLAPAMQAIGEMATPAQM